MRSEDDASSSSSGRTLRSVTVSDSTWTGKWKDVSPRVRYITAYVDGSRTNILGDEVEEVAY